MEPWTIAAGRVTLKLERKAIEGAFAKEIAGLHAKRPAEPSVVSQFTETLRN